jgi:DNA-binding NarL/FixJ family response regulator
MKKNCRDTRKVRILLVDDHPSTRSGARLMIETERDLEVCGEADTAEEGLEAAIRLSPSLVITDVTLPGRSGLELVQDLAARCPLVPVLVFSMHSEFTYARRALQVGARGYIMKSEDGSTLLQAIRTVMSGRISLSPTASSRLLEFVTDRSKQKRMGIEALSPREFEVFRLIGRGICTKDIADQLHLSIKTVDTHRARIKEKVGVNTLAELISISSTWLTEQSMTPPAAAATSH